MASVKLPSTGRVNNKKQLQSFTKPIGDFMNQVYIPKLKEYKYHRNHFIMLSKNYTGKDRRENGFMKSLHDVFTSRDYAERLMASFDMEIMSQHFGGNASVSMEGCSVEAVKQSVLDLSCGA